MRLCFIADMNSIHVKKWVRFFCERGHDVYVISSFHYPESTFHSANVVNITQASARNFSRSLLSKIRLLGVAKKLRRVSQKILPLPDNVIYKKAERLAQQSELQAVQKQINIATTNDNQVRDLVYSFKPDLVQCLRLVPEGLLGSCVDFQPLILFGWGQDISLWCTKYSELAVLARRALPRCTAYFADNHRDIRDAHEYGFPKDRFWHITPSGGGVKTEELQGSRLQRPQDNTEPVTFLTFRRIGGYFIDNRPILRAIKILREREKLNVRFKMVGSLTGTYYDIVRIEAKRLGISNYIEFEAPFPYSKLGEIISKYEFIVSSATHDGTTNALLETMWLGGIPLNSDLEPIREWITDGVNGYLFDINNPEHIAQKFMQAMSERQKHDEFRVINQDIIRTRADYNTCMSKVENIYQEMIERFPNSERALT